MIPLVDRDTRPRRAWEEILGVVVVLAGIAIICVALNYQLWFRNTTTNGGDMGAHVWWPATLRDHWFGQLRLSGWSPDWYAGFPVGQFYFPFPAVAIVAIEWLTPIPYDVAFKLVAVSGAVMLPIAAYVFARAMRLPWPAAPLCAVAATRFLFEVRLGLDTTNADEAGWTIYGGNLPSLLAGEFSYTIALAMCLFFLAALAFTLRTGRRGWLAALLLAATVMSHIVVAVFAAVGGVIVWLVHRPHRTFLWTAGIGLTGALLSAVWWLPLLMAQGYTTSMRYEKKTHYAQFLFGIDPDRHPSSSWMPRPIWLWVLVFVAVVLGAWWQRWGTMALAAITTVFGLMFWLWPADHHVWNTRYLPIYYLGLALLAATGAAELARLAGFAARRSARWVREGDRLDRARGAGAAAAGAGGTGMASDPGAEPTGAGAPDAPDDHDVPEAADGGGGGARAEDTAGPEGEPAAAGRGLAAYAGILPAGEEHVGDERAGDERAGTGADGPPAARDDAGSDDAGSDDAGFDDAGFDDAEFEARSEALGARWFAITTSAVMIVVSAWSLIWIRGFSERPAWIPKVVWNHLGVLHDDNRWAIPGWAKWNFTGYQGQEAWPEYRTIMDTVGDLPSGRLLWEPSAGSPDYIDRYGTSLALELIPYFTDGRIGSMEGLYFEASATTPYHFLTVAELADRPSNPVRGLLYGTLEEDFDLGIEHLRMLGVRYFMAWSPDAIAKANASADLTLVAKVPPVSRDAMVAAFGETAREWNGWRIYEVRDVELVEPLEYEPVVARNLRGGGTSDCFEEAGDPPADAALPEPQINGWECVAVPWFRDGEALEQLFAEDGPSQWRRVDASWHPCRDLRRYPQREGTDRPCRSPYRALADVPREPLPPVEVSDIEESIDSISFRVDRTDVPVLVKTSYFPNWKVSGAKGPYRVAPNLMVVVPTSSEVRLSYGLTGADWLGRLAWVFGVVGLVLLVLVRPRFSVRDPRKRSAPGEPEPEPLPDLLPGEEPMGAGPPGPWEAPDPEGPVPPGPTTGAPPTPH